MEKRSAKIILSLLAVMFTSNAHGSGISITEIMQSNFGGVLDYYNEFPDSWVEVHNTGENAIDLKGYGIAEKNDIGQSYKISKSIVVKPGEYALIYCDEENFDEHTNFKLNSDKAGKLYIWDTEGELVDSLHYPEMIGPEVSYGRVNEKEEFMHYRIATPGKANNNTYTERVMKKVDFSHKGGATESPFWLKLSLKGDYPEDAVIRYTTDGTEPDNYSKIFKDSIYISDNTVVRAKPFSDSAISKISKTQTYIFDASTKMPIINISCNRKYLYDHQLGILVRGSYASTHPLNPCPREWEGSDCNYFYNWRRPVNIEYYTYDSSDVNFNQLAETRISGNASRKELDVKSMVIYANKRFGDKHFEGVFWKERPKANKQKSMLIRASSQDIDTYYQRDMMSHMTIGRMHEIYDIDFEAQRNVQYYINGEFQTIMHLQERDKESNVWANNNKLEDIELIESTYYLYEEEADRTDYPNYQKLYETYKSAQSTYEELAEQIDINEFMNYISTQAFFANIDFPNNNCVVWLDKQGTKKWRWILKDMDGTIFNTNNRYYNYLLRKEPFVESFANTKESCEFYQKMFSLDKFKQPYIDRTTVLTGTAQSEKNIELWIDSISNEMSMVLSKNDYLSYLDNIEYFYEWNVMRHQFYAKDMSDFFDLGDTTYLRIRGTKKDSVVYFNNNTLANNKFDGYYFEGRDIYLSHKNDLDIYGLKNKETEKVSYLQLPKLESTNDSTKTAWTVYYVNNDKETIEHYTNEVLHYNIPEGAKNVLIIDGYITDNSITTAKPVATASRNPEELTYEIYTVGGVLIGKCNYEEFRNREQQDHINIVVVYDSLGKKLYSVKLVKD